MNSTKAMERESRVNTILEQEGKNFRIQYQTIWKNNREVEQYILKERDSCVAMAVRYQQEWDEISDRDIISELEKIMEENEIPEIHPDGVMSKQKIKEMVRAKVVSIRNERMLKKKGITYLPFLDMAVLFSVPVGKLSNGELNLQINDGIIETLQLSKDELLEDAIRNMSNEVQIIPMRSVLGEMMKGDDMPEQILEEVPMWILTNPDQSNSAAVLICPEVRKQIERLEEEQKMRLAIIPSSIHECLLFPLKNEDDLEKYAVMVNEVNQTAVSPEEQLTENVYYLENGELRSYR